MNQRSTLAGTLFPAMHTTLYHYLSTSLDAEADKPALVAAAELDPAILLALLATGQQASGDIGNWHESVGQPMMQAVAIAMSSAAVVRSWAPYGLERGWRDALVRSFLADALAGPAGYANTAESRLTGLIAGIGGWFEPAGDTVRADGAAADFLERLGCAPRVCEAVRYSHETMDQLQGTAPLLRLNAIAGQLVEYVVGPEMIPAEQLSRFHELLGVGEEEIYDVLGRAGRAFESATNALGEISPNPTGQRPADSLADLVSGAGTGAVFYRALVKSREDMSPEALIDQTGRFLFGLTGMCRFSPLQDGLVATLDDGETVQVDASRQDSNISRSYRENSMIVATRLKITDLIERQLLGRFEAAHLVCLPLGGAGLLVCGIDQSFAEHIDHHKALLTAWADAAADLYEMRPERGENAITMEELDRKVREITHEVNNPLAIVQNYLRTLSLKLGRESELQRDIDAISREITRVGGVVQKYGRIGKREELALQQVDLNGLVRELLGIVKGGRDDLEIDTRLDASIPAMELAADALRQVLLNILKNAAEALEGVPGARIDVTTQGAVNRDGRHYIEVVVSDNGPGMSQEQRLALFADDASSKGEGRGLGLRIVKQLLHDMSGTITCRENNATPGSSGTSFQILLPLEHDWRGDRQ